MSGWKFELFGCFADCTLCLITYFVPCYTAGQNAEKVGKSCCLYGCLSILGPIGIWSRASVRGEIRDKQNIEGGFLTDCCIHWFCGLCALVQEAQEMKDGGGPRGHEMSRE